VCNKVETLKVFIFQSLVVAEALKAASRSGGALIEGVKKSSERIKIN
jgi:hypothetical protein